MGATTLGLGVGRATFAAVAFDDIRHPVELTATSARFVQTVGGHTAVPAPRRVSKPPFVKFEAPTVWTTLALTIHADGASEFELTGASAFPRHWVYDHAGALAAKAGHGRLQGMVATLVRQAHAVGRPGLARSGHRRGDGARARARRTHHARGREVVDPQAQAGRAAHRARGGRRRRLPPPQRRARASRSTANRSPRSAPAPSSASVLRSKAAFAPRRCGR